MCVVVCWSFNIYDLCLLTACVCITPAVDGNKIVLYLCVSSVKHPDTAVSVSSLSMAWSAQGLLVSNAVKGLSFTPP